MTSNDNNVDHNNNNNNNKNSKAPAPLPDNLCQAVRQTCRAWYDDHQDTVRIQNAPLQQLAREILDTQQQQQRQQQQSQSQSPQQSQSLQAELVAWDQEGWHYHPPTNWPVRLQQERVALYILALDAINFCFWPSQQQQQQQQQHDHHAANNNNNSRSRPSSSSPFEYKDLAQALTAAAQRDHVRQAQDVSCCCPDYCLTATRLRDCTVAQMQDMLLLLIDDSCQQQSLLPPLPDLRQRCQLWNQVGRVLLQHFDGSAYQLVLRAQGSAVQAVRLLYEYFEGFRDVVTTTTTTTTTSTTTNNNHVVYFLKRAQICVADWQAALSSIVVVDNNNQQQQQSHQQQQQHKQQQLWQNDNTDQFLTCFADYRLPQLLRQRGVLVYAPDLAQAVDAHNELAAGSPAEVSIRAATVVAVDQLVLRLQVLQQRQQNDKNDNDDDTNKNGMAPPNKKAWTAVAVDWYLWQVGERLDAAGQLSPHHRVRTIYY